ncbi:MAG: hypothetical protein ACH346_05160 [Chthoniobacterales bacterium]
MARCKLAQYAQPQNDFSIGSRTFQVCFAILKIIFRPSLYANLLTPITVFRIISASRSVHRSTISVFKRQFFLTNRVSVIDGFF